MKVLTKEPKTIFDGHTRRVVLLTLAMHQGRMMGRWLERDYGTKMISLMGLKESVSSLQMELVTHRSSL
jgi:hypothetical protein